MGMRLPPMNALRAFEAVARCGSLQAAAQELGVVRGAVRLQIRQLEAHFGVALFERSSRKLTLTPTGQRFAQATGIAFGIIGRAAEEVSTGSARPRLRVGVPAPMAASWLVPRLPQFNLIAPDLELDVVPVPITAVLADRADLDAMIMGGEYRPLPEMSDTRFMDDEFGPVAAPQAWQSANGDPLSGVTALVARVVPGLWDDWFRESGRPPIRFPRRIEYEDLTLAISAARAGLGVVIAPRASIEADLETGVLQSPLGFISRSDGYHLCCRSHDSDNRSIRILRDWLVAQGNARTQLTQEN